MSTSAKKKMPPHARRVIKAFHCAKVTAAPFVTGVQPKDVGTGGWIEDTKAYGCYLNGLSDDERAPADLLRALRDACGGAFGKSSTPDAKRKVKDAELKKRVNDHLKQQAKELVNGQGASKSRAALGVWPTPPPPATPPASAPPTPTPAPADLNGPITAGHWWTGIAVLLVGVLVIAWLFS